MSAFDHGWTAEQLALKRSAIEFTRREVAPHLDEWERAGEVPRSLQKKLAAAGLLGVGVSEEVGGDGGTLLDACAMQEGFMEAGWSGGLMASAYTHGIAIPHIVQHGSPELVAEFVRPVLAGDRIGSLGITEPGAGSDVAALATRAVREGGEWVINGAKTFITSSVRGDFVTTAVRTGPDGAHGISLIVVPTDAPGFSVSRRLDKMGWRASDTGELSFVDCRVPAGNLVGEENHGFYYIAENFVAERIWLAVLGYGHAIRCLALAARHAHDRSTFGRPLVGHQAVRAQLTEMHRRTSVARCYALETVRRFVDGENVMAEACLAKQTAVEAAVAVADAAVQLHGGMGYMTDSEVERHYRDVRILPIGGGATEVLTDLAAKVLGYAP